MKQQHFGQRYWRRSGLAAIAASLLLFGTATAVTVAPFAVYLDSRTRTSALTLLNNGTRAEEIQLEFAFGYPRSDSAGNVSVDLTAEAPAGEPSATAWLRAFPQRLVLQPGQRQVVRVLVEPPPGTPDGEYWARVLLKSRGGQAPVEQQRDDVTLQLEIETILALGVVYRQGQVQSGIEIDSASAVVTGDTVTVLTDLRRTGNAAFVGRVVAELMDGGTVLATAELPVPVHYELRRILHLPALPGGNQVRLRIDNRRDDMPSKAPLPMEPITLTIPVQGAVR